MTPEERRNPSQMVDQSRRRRIAAGAGVEPHEVNELVKQFDVMADMMKKMSSMGMRERMQTMQQLGSSGMLEPRRQAGEAEGRHRQAAHAAGEGQAAESCAKGNERRRKREVGTAAEAETARMNSGSPDSPANPRAWIGDNLHCPLSTIHCHTEENGVAVRIRMKKLGRKHRPFYRICAMDSGRRATAASWKSWAPTTRWSRRPTPGPGSTASGSSIG